MTLRLAGFITFLLLPAFHAFGDETSAEFFLIDDRLHVVGLDQAGLAEECEHLRTYGQFIALRNGLEQVQLNCESEIRALSAAEQVRAVHPSDFYKISSHTYFTPGRLFYGVDVSDVIPKQIWERQRVPKPYDGVCYNSALVESGILSLADYSLFLSPIGTLVGMKEVNVTVSPKRVHLSVERRGLGHALIRARKAWEFDASTWKTVKREMRESMAKSFVPGSILCIAPGGIQRKPQIRKSMEATKALLPPETQVTDNLDELDDSEYLEESGGHCLTFLTPSLISESNAELPHSLVSWDRAFAEFMEFAEYKSVYPPMSGKMSHLKS